MPFDITITLSVIDLQKFQESIDKGKLAVNDQVSAEAIEQKASELIELATGGNLHKQRDRVFAGRSITSSIQTT